MSCYNESNLDYLSMRPGMAIRPKKIVDLPLDFPS